jgi:hypothetical protein
LANNQKIPQGCNNVNERLILATMDPQLFIIAALVIWVVVAAIIEAIKKQKIADRLKKEREAEIAFVHNIMDGFNPQVHSNHVVKILEDTLPTEYRCGKGGCQGLLLKNSQYPDYYRCNVCGHLRTTVKVKSLT